MRPITDELRRAQALPNVAWDVSVRVRRAGISVGEYLEWVSGGEEPASAWKRVWDFHNAPYYVSGQPWRARSGACWAAQPDTMLQAYRSDQAAKVGVRRAALTTTSVGLTAPVDVSVIVAPDGADVVSRPALARLGSTVRLVWADGAFLYWSESTDDGVTWSARGVLYNGVGSYVAHTNISLAVTASGAWAVCYTALTAAGERRLRGAHDVGSGWVNWPPHTTTVDWLVAGIAELTATHCIVYLSGRNYTWSSLAVGTITLAAGAFVAWWTGQPEIVDRAGLQGEIEYDGVTVGVGGGAVYLIMREGLPTSNRYWALAGLLGGAGSVLMEEPVFLTTFDLNTLAEEETHFDMLAASSAIFLVGAGVILQLAMIYRQVPMDALIIKEYTYQQRVGEGGRLLLHCERSGLARWLRVGDWLELTRRASATTSAGDVIGGSDRRIFRVVDVVQRRSGIWEQSLIVTAVDSLGVLAAHRLRRQHVLRAGDRTVRQDLESIAAWSGCWLDIEGVGILDGAGLSAGFVCSPRSLNLTALQQYLLAWPYVLRCGRRDVDDGTGGWGQFSVIAMHLGSDVYAGEPTANFVEPEYMPGFDANIGHPVGAWEQRLTTGDVLTVVLGMNRYGTLSEVWSASSTSGYNSVRPTPDVRVSRAWDANNVGAIALAEYVRNVPSNTYVRAEIPAHVGIELWELVVWRDDERLRVIAIREQWKGGRLMMEIELG